MTNPVYMARGLSTNEGVAAKWQRCGMDPRILRVGMDLDPVVRCGALRRRGEGGEDAMATETLSMFAEPLEYKLGWRGKQPIKVPAAYTSPRCSACGHVHA